MIELSGELQAAIIFGLLAIIRELIAYMIRRNKSETSEDTAAAAERQRYMDMLEMVLNRQHEKFADLTLTFKNGMTEVAQGIQRNFDASLAHMTAVTTDRKKEMARLRTDVQSIPHETERILHESFKQGPDLTAAAISPRLDNMQNAITFALNTVEKKIIDHIGPQADGARAAIKQDLHEIKTDFARVKSDFSSIFDRLNEIQNSVNNIDPTKASTPQQPASIVGYLGNQSTTEKDN